MKKVLLAVNAEEYDHLCIAMDAHLDHLLELNNDLYDHEWTQTIRR
jgi:hypothetical protein